MNFFVKTILLLMIFVGVILINAQKTSADLVAQKRQMNNKITATTLSFSSLNTTNFDVIRWFFNIESIKPNGYEIKPLKVKNEGSLNFNYLIKVNKKNSDENFCEAISLRVIKDWQKIYDGSLLDLKLNQKMTLEKDYDLIFEIYFNKKDASLKEKQCNFDFELKTWKNNPDEKEKGLFAKQTLSNTVRSGKW